MDSSACDGESKWRSGSARGKEKQGAGEVTCDSDVWVQQQHVERDPTTSPYGPKHGASGAAVLLLPSIANRFERSKCLSVFTFQT